MESVPPCSCRTARPSVVYPVPRKRYRRARLAADVTMLIGNAYVPGHAERALDLVRTDPGVRMLFDARLDAD